MPCIILEPTASSYKYEGTNLSLCTSDDQLILAHLQYESTLEVYNLILNITPGPIDLSLITIENAVIELPISEFYSSECDFHTEILITSSYDAKPPANESYLVKKGVKRLSKASISHHRLCINVTSFMHYWVHERSSICQLMLSIKDPGLLLKIHNRPKCHPKLHIEYQAYPSPSPMEDSSALLYITLNDQKEGILSAGQTIIFHLGDLDLVHRINYTSETGIFSFQTPGHYYMQWILNLAGTRAVNSIAVGLKNHATGKVLVFHSPRILPGQITGQYILNIKDTTTNYSLINSSDGDIQLAALPTQASLTVYKI